MDDTSIIERLRQITEDALRRAAEREAAKHVAEEERAQEILTCVDRLAEDQARQGRHFAVVMDVTYTGRPRLFQGPTLFQLAPENLTGASRKVWDHCVQSGLDPVLVGRWTEIAESQHRVDFSLVIRW